MRRVAAPLAAVLCGLALSGCGDGAEPGAPEGATLVLDFQPNAVHAGLYAAKARGYFEDEGVDLEIQEPSSTADGAKLLEAGRADFAILDINDFGIARVRGLDIVAVAAIVQRPLASVIAAEGNEVRTPADLEGKTIGVTGVPSDDAVLDTILAEGGVDAGSVSRQTIGFKSVPLLAAGKIDAATAFWNAEGVELTRQGIPIREFRVDEFGAPRYPELVLATSRDVAGQARRSLLCGVVLGLERGYEVLDADPGSASRDLLAAAPALDPGAQQEQIAALLEADAFTSPAETGDRTSTLDPTTTKGWIRWARETGLLGTEVSSLVGAFASPAARCS
jgi:NitT/TauT family transport system substrate-binding protein/putative hydroxymethylpyrimidine transport system substrate-binding protein